MAAFKPGYVWPNRTFPFRIYFQNDLCRIFILENLQHNFSWMQQYASSFRPSDVFFVIVGCHYNKHLVDEADRMFSALNLNKQQFHILFNDAREADLFSARGFTGTHVNQNAFLDENKVMRPTGAAKKYDAIYVGRLIKLKRHHLAAEVPNLALVAGNLHGSNVSEAPPPHTYVNSVSLSPEQVCVKINESRCGLILSAVEGASFASSEYLLCGVPVVSTKSEGGRDTWYTDYNSRVVDATPAAVKAAVELFVNNPRDPHVIRRVHVAQAEVFRSRFVDLLDRTLKSRGVESVNAESYFREHFFHKMRTSYAPAFDQIFL
jgi:glycosyltransferase involved in cell wall biosynthesis